MKTALLLFGGLREYWWPNRISDIKNKILKPNNADLFMFFDKWSSESDVLTKHEEFNFNIYTRDNELNSLQELYAPHLKSLYLLADPFNDERWGTRKSNSLLINSYITNNIFQKFNSNENIYSIENIYHTQYQEKLEQILSKFKTWLEELPQEERILKIHHIGKITDLYLKMFHCWKLMEEYEFKNGFRYDRVIVARVDMLYDDLEFLPENDVVYFCEPWRSDYQADCFYYGNRYLIEKICTNLINEYGNFIVKTIATMGEFNMMMIIKKYNIPIQYIKYCPGDTKYGYKLFKV